MAQTGYSAFSITQNKTNATYIGELYCCDSCWFSKDLLFSRMSIEMQDFACNTEVLPSTTVYSDICAKNAIHKIIEPDGYDSDT